MTQTVVPVVQRSLLNPQFENYQLQPNDVALAYTKLDAPLHRLSGFAINSTCPYRLLELHTRYNHLFPLFDGSGALFIDSARWICLAQMDESCRIQVTKLQMLAPPLQENTTPAGLHLPPSIVFASHDMMLASDGMNTLEIFKVDSVPCFQIHKIASIVLPRELSTQGMMIYEAVVASNGDLLVCTQQTFNVETLVKPNSKSSATEQHLYDTKKHKFLVSLVRVQIPVSAHASDSNLNTDTTVIADIVMSLHGESAPYFAQIESDTVSLTIGAPTPFESLIHASDTDATVPSNGDEHNAESTLSNYSWTQSGDEITVNVNLPKQLLVKRDIRVVFQPTGVSVKAMHSGQVLFAGDLFDHVRSSECIWTLEGSHQLVLYLQKTHAGTRWPHLFMHDDGVLETLDAATLESYTNKLDKYHNSKQLPVLGELSSHRNMECDDSSDNGSPAMHFQTVTERQENIDFEAHLFFIDRFVVDQVSSSTVLSHRCGMPGMAWIGMQLSQPLERSPVVLVQSDVDALAFKIKPGLELEHISTLSALAFVQASKQDKKLVTLTGDMRLALVVEFKQYVYVYERPEVKQMHAKQLVLNIGQGSQGGMVLGIAQIGSGHVMILTEDSFVGFAV
ncbi:hypothetical protein QVD99_001168 [Batrachochytrium dendrobatidis]|nr:hypothetical protein QVD99_001168 [Batrachochytrium dendrobatidis]